MPGDAPTALDETPPRLSLGRRVLLFPLVRIFVALIWVMTFPYAISGIFQRLHGPLALARDIFAATSALGLYYLFVRVVERRQPGEIAARPAVPEAAFGFGWGVALMSIIIGILGILGTYHIVGVYSVSAFWDIAALSVLSGVLEEVMFRGIIFRITEEGLGTVGAFLLSALLFGFAHSGNHGATAISSTAIALEAGTLLAALYLWRRRLWAAIGIHAGWNFTQAALGAPVSGVDLNGIVAARFSGPAWLTGGTFGPEAGLVAFTVALLSFVYFLHLALKRESLRVPAWMRRAFKR